MTARLASGVTRIAPTPSGWLHIGNLCSFLWTRFWADYSGSEVLLRIDDLDTERTRDVFIEDIFNQLRWAEIAWEVGPKNPEDHREHFSQPWNFEYYKAVLDEKRARFPNVFFVCDCSRKDKSEGAACSCRGRSIELKKGVSALMLDLKPWKGQSILLTDFWGQETAHAFQFPTDEIPLFRKEGFFAYHWVSLNEDRRHRVNHVVRGQDLWESTLLQAAIEINLFEDDLMFSRARFFHHDLLKGPDGEKLSKSESSQSILDLRSHGFSHEHMLRVFADFAGLGDFEEISREAVYQALVSKWQSHQK